MGQQPSGAADRAHVVIVGGGYAGLMVAMELEGKCKVTIVDERNFLLHKVVVPRACVSEEAAELPTIPRGFAAPSARSLHCRVDRVDDDNVVHLENGDSIRGDFVVICTGARAPNPFDTVARTATDARAEIARCRAAVACSRRTVVVGGGPTGVEVAGEIAAAAKRAGQSDKTVTLVHAGPTLLSKTTGPVAVPKALVSFAEQQLAARGVRVLLSHRVEAVDNMAPDSDGEGVVSALSSPPAAAPAAAPAALGSSGREVVTQCEPKPRQRLGGDVDGIDLSLVASPSEEAAGGEETRATTTPAAGGTTPAAAAGGGGAGAGAAGDPRSPGAGENELRAFVTGELAVRCSNGAVVEADLVVWCTGLRANTALLRGGLAAVVDARGRIQVDEYLRVRGRRTVFAAGDCAGAPAAQLAHAAMEQGRLVARNIQTLISHRDDVARGWKHMTKCQESRSTTMMLTLDPAHSAGVLSGFQLPGFVAAHVKGHDLLTGRIRSDYKVPAGVVAK